MNVNDHIWAAFRSGEEEAFSNLFRAYYAILKRYGLKLVRDEEVVKDSIQDFFLYLFENREKLATDVGNPTSYLISSFRRRLLREVGIQRNKRIVENEEDNFPQDFFQIGVEDIIVKTETQEFQKKFVVKLLNELPPQQREILYLKYYLNLSLPEIAEALSISYQVTANHTCRAMKKLRDNTSNKGSALGNIWTIFI